MADADARGELDDEVRTAIREVQREQGKADAIVASVYAALVLVGTSLALTVVGVGTGLTVGPIRLVDAVGIVAGLGVGGLTFVRRYRRPAVERFERANPQVAEAFRTARDAVEADRDGPVTRRLYGEVLDALRETSSRDLLPWRQLAAVLAVVGIMGVAVLGVQVAGVDLVGVAGLGGLGGTGGPDQGPAAPGDSDDPQPVLRDPGSVLDGASENFTLGDDEVEAILDAYSGGPGEDDENESSGGDGEFPDGREPIAPQSAGYADSPPVEEAELIREYTLAVQGNQSAEAEASG